MIKEKKLNYTIHSFQTKDQLTLIGILNHSKTTNQKHKQTVILHIHGMCGDLFSKTGQNLAKIANKNKISTFIINTRGHGIVSSFKKIDKKTNKKIFETQGTAFENFENSELDIQSAINYLKTLNYKNIILSGHSTGCQKITHYQLQNPKNKIIKSLILLAPGDDLNIEKQNKTKQKFQETLKFAKQNLHKKILFHSEDFGILSTKRYYDLFKKTSIEGNLFNYTKNLTHLQKIKIPILTLIGAQDQYFQDIEQSIENIKHNTTHKKSTTKIIGGDHSYNENEQELQEEINKFLQTII